LASIKFVALSFSIISSFFCLTSCQNSPKNLPVLPQDPFIQVYFNHNQAKNAEYVEPYRQFKRQGDNLENIIIEQINSANFSIDIAVQELNLSKIAQALIDKYKAGIKVRIVLENNYNHDKNSLPNSHGLRLLKEAKIPLIDDREDGSKGSGLMHHKFMVIDQTKVITGSANFTLSGIHGDFDNPQTRGNVNHLLVINSSELAELFTQEFNYLWGDGVGGEQDSLFGLKKPHRQEKIMTIGNSMITVKFSPTSRSQLWQKTTNGLISETLERANYSLDLALFVFSDQGIANTLQRESSAGVTIRALIDPYFAFQYYSEALDLLGVALPRKCRYEKDNNPWQKSLETVGIPNLPLGDKLHHKFAVIDNLTVITGSHNWSDSANHINDETLLIITNPVIAQHFSQEFNHLYSQAQLGIPPHIQTKITEQKEKCNL
jgi:phosphatidylserine/phosphatidylglycerophosphate/cardiolipin synthase-like enzyme